MLALFCTFLLPYFKTFIVLIYFHSFHPGLLLKERTCFFVLVPVLTMVSGAEQRLMNEDHVEADAEC